MKLLSRVPAFAAALSLAMPPAGVSAPQTTGRETPFTMLKAEPAQWKKRQEPLKLGEAVYPAVLETPGFLFAGDPKISPQQLAAFAQEEERLWSELAGQLPVFGEKLAGRKMLVLIHANEEQTTKLRVWASEGTKGTKYAPSPSLAVSGISYLLFRPELQENLGVQEMSRVFRLNVYSASDPRRTAWPERAHLICSTLFQNLLRDVENTGTGGWGLPRLGFAYFKEWRAAGKIETELKFSGSGNEIEGFRRGKSWFTAVKAVVKNGAKPSLVKLLATKADEAHPVDLGFAFALMHFIHRNPEKLKAFDGLIRKRIEAKSTGTAADFAEGLGFATPEELDAAWLAWINGMDFR